MYLIGVDGTVAKVNDCARMSFAGPGDSQRLTLEVKIKMDGSCSRHLQLDCLVPVDHISGKTKTFNVHHMNVASVGADVQPFALESQMTECDSVSKERKKMNKLLKRKLFKQTFLF